MKEEFLKWLKTESKVVILMTVILFIYVFIQTLRFSKLYATHGFMFLSKISFGEALINCISMFIYTFLVIFFKKLHEAKNMRNK